MDYKQAVDYLASYTDYEKMPMPHDPAFYDLRRVHELMSRLGNPHLKAKSVHITGTNGKGSVAVMVASVLTASGYTVGLYTSPHLHTWRERIKVDGEMISEGELVSLVERVKPEVEAVNRRAAYGEITTFELLTALAFTRFGEKMVDFQVLEVGMGGRFDATSVINPEVCIITPISFDHTQVLGDTLAEIAGEKAAIIKPGCVAVIASQQEEAEKVIEAACSSRHAGLVKLGRDVIWEGLAYDSKGQQLRVRGRLDSHDLSIPLLGQHQLENAATAVAALEVLAERGYKISRESIVSGLARVSWPGRLHVLSRHPLLVVDGAHNPGAARRLKESLERHFNYNRAILVMGASNDKDIAGVVSELYPLFRKAIVTRADHPRAAAPERIAVEFKQRGVDVQVTGGIAEAMAAAVAMAGEGDLICVVGSLFVVAEAIEQAKLIDSLNLSL